MTCTLHLSHRSPIIDVHQDPITTATRLRAVAIARITASSCQWIGARSNHAVRRRGIRSPTLSRVFSTAVRESLDSTCVHTFADCCVRSTTRRSKRHAVVEQARRDAIDVAGLQAPRLVAGNGKEGLFPGVVDNDIEPIASAAHLGGIARACHVAIGSWCRSCGCVIATPAFGGIFSARVFVSESAAVQSTLLRSLPCGSSVCVRQGSCSNAVNEAAKG